MSKVLTKQLYMPIRWLLIAISYTYIYWYIQSYAHFAPFWQQLTQNLPVSSVYFWLALLLMPINWGIEALKWRTLLYPNLKMPIGYSFKAVLSGVSIGIFTPNRIGEIGGRIALLPKHLRIKGGYLTLMGSLSQLLTTLTMGAAAVGYLILQKDLIHFSYLNTHKNLLSALFIVSYVICLAAFFKNQYVIRLVGKIRWLKQFIPSTTTFHIPKRTLAITLLLSHLRYLVFASQFVLLLYYFQVDIAFMDALCGIAATYFILGIVPSTTLIELGIRGSISMVILGAFAGHNPGILFASMLLWIINLALPSILGSVFFLKTR